MGKLTQRHLDPYLKDGRPVAGKPVAGLSDGGGLSFTLSNAGTATWVFRYRLAGKQRELTLGNFPDMSLAAARIAARAARVKVDQGTDVATEKRKTKLEASRAGTFRQLGEDYMLRAAPALSATTANEIRRYFDKDILPRIGHVAAGALSGSDIVAMVERIAERSDSVARHAFDIVSVIYAHGIAKHYVSTNPCAGLKLSAILGQRPARRARVMLTEPQIKSLLDALPSLGRSNALAAKILLATCVRKSELLQAMWGDVDLENGNWTIPPENSKSGRGFVVPLAPIVVTWFSELKSIAGKSVWVLPGQRGAHMSRTTLNVALDRLDVAGLPSFSPHDLRSTARSHLARLGVSIPVAERCLNHSLGGLVAIYDQHDYLTERRRALELWASVLSPEQDAPSNVTPLRVAA